MQFDKQLVVDELRTAGQNERVDQAVRELPDRIDHEQHAATLQKLGLDPGQLAEKAVQRGLALP